MGRPSFFSRGYSRRIGMGPDRLEAGEATYRERLFFSSQRLVPARQEIGMQGGSGGQGQGPCHPPGNAGFSGLDAPDVLSYFNWAYVNDWMSIVCKFTKNVLELGHCGSCDYF